VLRHVTPTDEILEVGCGTGYMLCRPLARLGYRVRGIDLDQKSIEYGKDLLRKAGLDPDILTAGPLAETSHTPTVVIVSEVLEHLHDPELVALLAEIRARLAPPKTLLVTVPNGYGWFELEDLLWSKLGLGRPLYRWGFCHLVESTKARHLGPAAVDPGEPSTLAGSPHVQRFTLAGISGRLQEAGFEIVERRGSVAFAGPFSNLFFAGFDSVLAANGRWGDRWGRFASGYFLACRAIP
jgi:SAM-dependent methyltransferase